MKMRIPFYSLEEEIKTDKRNIIENISSVIESGQFIMGNALQNFEKDFAHYIGCDYAVGVSNGYDALFLSLKACGIGNGDEVIVPAHTFIASILAIIRVGATPILVDVYEDDMTIDCNQIIQNITKHTKAIIPVHLYGHACNMDELKSISEDYNILLIEDYAQAHGTKIAGNMAGSLGNCNATSFYPTKTLGCFGDAGAITTNDQEVYSNLLSLRNYGSSKKYHHDKFGFNHRMDEIQAAILNYKLAKLEERIDIKRSIVHFYYEQLQPIEQIKLPKVTVNYDPSWHLFVIRTNNRDALKAYLEQKGIQTLIHYPIPCHKQRAIHKYIPENKSFPVTENISKTCLSLPLFSGLSNTQAKYITASIANFYGRSYIS